MHRSSDVLTTGREATTRLEYTLDIWTLSTANCLPWGSVAAAVRTVGDLRVKRARTMSASRSSGNDPCHHYTQWTEWHGSPLSRNQALIETDHHHHGQRQCALRNCIRSIDPPSHWDNLVSPTIGCAPLLHWTELHRPYNVKCMDAFHAHSQASSESEPK